MQRERSQDKRQFRRSERMPDIQALAESLSQLTVIEAADLVKTLEEKYPALNKISVSHPVGTPQSVILEQLQQFSEEVMPAFKGRVQDPIPAD